MFVTINIGKKIFEFRVALANLLLKSLNPVGKTASAGRQVIIVAEGGEFPFFLFEGFLVLEIRFHQ